jgi:hypothetical protein
MNPIEAVMILVREILEDSPSKQDSVDSLEEMTDAIDSLKESITDEIDAEEDEGPEEFWVSNNGDVD